MEVNSLESALKPIRDQLTNNEIEDAISTLLLLDEKFSLRIADEVTQQSAAYHQNEGEKNLVSTDDYRRFKARIVDALLYIIKGIPKKAERNAAIGQLNNLKAVDPTGGTRLEKIIGGQSTILRVNWLEKALKASKSVCKISRTDGEVGTGWLIAGGWLVTNNHVLPSVELAKTATAEFNFELDMFGDAKNRVAYELDTSDFRTDAALDFTRIKVKDRTDKPLKEWGFLEIDPEAVPVKGEPVTIIQHPEGEDKQIALNANDVLGQQGVFLYYSTDTKGGSSGSPVFNKNWKVVAIHHAGVTKNFDGSGIPKEANEGILMKHVAPKLK